MRKRRRLRSAWTRGLLVAALLLRPFALLGQADPSALDPSSRTRAVPFMAWGAAGGAVLGGLSLGVLAWGLCDSADCSGSFGDGFVWGALGGAAYGGLTGLVTGSAFRRGGEGGAGGSAPWSWTVSGGPVWVGHGELEGWRAVAGARATRPTTERVSFGFEARYLGRVTNVREVGFPPRTGVSVRRSRWHMFGLGMVARLHLDDPRGGPLLLATTSAYPLHEFLVFEEEPGNGLPSRVEDGKWGVFPGVGLGAGYVWGLGGGATAELQARIHGVVGAGDVSVLPVLQVSGGVGFR